MGLTLRGKFKGSPEYDMGYITFYRLRYTVADCISKEFGEAYRQQSENPLRLSSELEYDMAVLPLVKKHGIKKRILSFLYQSDADGRLSPFCCKAVLDQIQDHSSNDLFGYTARPAECMTFENFKELLRECWERRVYLLWY